MSKVQVDLEVNADQGATKVAVLERRVEELGKSMVQTNREAERAARKTAGSYARMEQELRDNVKQLKNMEVGSHAFTLQKKKVDQLQRALANAKGELKAGTTAAGRFQSVASAGLGQVTGLATGMMSLQAGVQAVVSELEKTKQIQLRSARQELTLEAALADIALNVGGDQVGTARRMIESNAKSLGTTQEGLANLLGVAISAGAKDLEEAMAVSAAGLKATVGDADKAAELVQTALDITSLSGSDNFEGALGQVAQVQSQVRSVNAQEFFANIGPALAAATADRANIDGISTERALEISSVVSQILKDRTGANTATAVRQFVTRLDSFVPELKTTLKDGSEVSLTKEQIQEFRSARSVDERIDMFRENDALARQFLDQQKEGIGKGAIAELIQGSIYTDRAKGFEDKASAGISSLDDARESYVRLVDGVQEGTVMLRADRRSQANIQAKQTGGVESYQGQVRKIMTDTINEMNLPGLDSWEGSTAQAQFDMAMDAGKDPAAEVIEYFENLQTFRGGYTTRELNAQEKALLDKQIDLLMDISLELKKPSPPPVVIRQPPPQPRPRGPQP